MTDDRGLQRSALLSVAILTAMNLLNYVDRYVPSAVKDAFKADLGLTDAQTSLPLTAFVFVYMLASPVFGSISDRVPRKWIVAGGVALWSAATAAAAYATGFWTFLAARALVGIGEAAYATLAPSILSDFFPPEKRNRVLTVFYVAIPVGTAIGFALGGWLGQHYGWRTAFLACGLPGLVTALLVLVTAEPERGRYDADRGAAPVTWREALKQLRSNATYVQAVLGYTAVTFAMGALADWFPTFLTRHRGFDATRAGWIVGLSIVIGGLAGTVLGGALGEWLSKRTRQPYLALCGTTMAIAAVLSVLALVVRGEAAIFATLVATQVFLWCFNGPLNALLVNCVPGVLRARAFSLSILSIHLFGDAISPSIVGVTSDLTGNLPLAIAFVPVMLAVGAMVWLRAWRVVPEPVA